MGKKFKKFCKNAAIVIGSMVIGATAYAFRDELVQATKKGAKKVKDLFDSEKPATDVPEEDVKEPVVCEEPAREEEVKPEVSEPRRNRRHYDNWRKRNTNN